VADLKFAWGQIFWEVLTRFYLVIGLLSALGLLTMGITSTDAAVRRLGPGWKRLHRLAYPVALLTTVHYLMQVKSGIDAPALAVGILGWLLAWRALGERRGRGLPALVGLTVFVALFTAAAEAAWYGLATGIDWRRVLGANLDQFAYLRPSGEAALMALAVLIIAALNPTLRPALTWTISRVRGPRPSLPWRARSP